MKASLATLASVALLLGACGWNDKPADGDKAGSGLVWGACPDEVAITLTARHRCGTLTVPVDHQDPSDDTLTLDVLEAWPASDTQATDVAVAVGFNFGEPAYDPGGMALLAERIGVPVVGLSARGVGEAGGRSLDCPELDDFGGTQVDQPDAAGREAFLNGVQDCRERLTAAGTDPTAFGLDDLAADLEALRTTMDIDRWHAVVTYGELARLSDAYAAAYGDRLRAIVKDSPPPAGRDSFAMAPEGTRSALAALFDECRGDRRCSQRYPDLERSWQRALERVGARPLSGTLADGAIVVDGPKLLRAMRAMLGGDGPGHVADLPRVITAAAEGEIHPTLALVVTRDPGYCNGYRPLCPKPGFSLGAYLSQVCPEVGIDDSARDGDSLYREVFSESPYVDACAIWDTAPSPAPESANGVPTLVLTGHLDAWSRPEWFAGAVVVRGATHDVAGSSPCVLEIRNPWIADPEADPVTAPCSSPPRPTWD